MALLNQTSILNILFRIWRLHSQYLTTVFFLLLILHIFKHLLYNSERQVGKHWSDMETACCKNFNYEYFLQATVLLCTTAEDWKAVCWSRNTSCRRQEKNASCTVFYTRFYWLEEVSKFSTPTQTIMILWNDVLDAVCDPL